MTEDELKEQIMKNKLQCFDLVRDFALKTMDPKLAGFKSHEDACLFYIGETAKKNEKLTVKWEKENPL
jgi:hypothetical protein